MKKAYITTNPAQTQKLGELLARELWGGEIICLTGELGSGKTTFAQGVLRGLKAKGPYTSPTFLVIKHYRKEIQSVYHIDCYRIKSQDILELGWGEIIRDKNNVVIVEWAEKIKKIVPKGAVWIVFSHLNENQRKIILSSKFKIKSEKLKLKV